MNRLFTSVAAALLLLCSTARSTTAFVAPKNSLARPSSIHQRQDCIATQKLGRSHFNSARETELGAALLLPGKLAAIGLGLAKFYKAQPLIAGFLTASTKAAVADCMAQYRDVCTTKFDIKRNLAMILYSGSILGALCSVMYNRIFPVIFAGETNQLLLAIKMTLFDGFINAPLIWLPPAYIAQAIVFQYPKRKALQKYFTDVKENGLLKKYWSLWLPMSMINFFLVPAHFRVAFVAGVSFFWMIILSLVANSNDQDVESCPVEPEPRLIAPRAME